MTLPPIDPALTGPYDAANNGRDAYGHPVNGYGRCEKLNVGDPSAVPPGCPTYLDRQTYLLTQPVDEVTSIATTHGIAIPPLLTGSALRTALVPLILTAEGLAP